MLENLEYQEVGRYLLRSPGKLLRVLGLGKLDETSVFFRSFGC